MCSTRNTSCSDNRVSQLRQGLRKVLGIFIWLPAAPQKGFNAVAEDEDVELPLSLQLQRLWRSSRPNQSVPPQEFVVSYVMITADALVCLGQRVDNMEKMVAEVTDTANDKATQAVNTIASAVRTQLRWLPRWQQLPILVSSCS
jgi:hypothetical protein